jgi:Carboxypeptidase regulatory-like domain
MRFICTAMVLLFLAATVLSQTEDGRIQGIVVDQSGTPVGKATVFVGTLARGPSTQTDANGRFMLEGVPAGNIGLHAFKPSDGHPYDMFTFFTMPGEKEPFVEVTSGQTVGNVVIQLGSRAASLTLDVTDESGTPIDATASFSRPDLGKTGNYERGIKSRESLLVPPVPFRLTVEAKGFESWHYGGSRWETDEGLLRLKPEQKLILSIKLKKNPSE